MEKESMDLRVVRNVDLLNRALAQLLEDYSIVESADPLKMMNLEIGNSDEAVLVDSLYVTREGKCIRVSSLIAVI